jgi:Tfp pilus tip-associated adhesin PilY1
MEALGVGTEEDALAVIQWQRSARFGLVSPHVLGGIDTSTAALLSEPTPPYWINLAATSISERASIVAYNEAYANRIHIVLVGAMDGALHAFYTNPVNRSDPFNGQEMWAFLPPAVVEDLQLDMNTERVENYAGGSPTLANAKIDDEWRSILVSGQGNGGKSVFALDVTESVRATNDVPGPTFLWSFTDPNMGHTTSKPTVIRTRVGETERWMAVFASGPGSSGDVGDTVYAVDLADGSLLWRFDLDSENTFISSDITAGETDDEDDTAIDGYIDRLVFADNFGRIWKLAPHVYNAGARTISSIGSIEVGAHLALFSVAGQGALGEARGITGSIGVAESSDGRWVAYFGTGGTAADATAETNGLFAIDLETGDIRQKLILSDGTRFIGGVSVTEGQIVTSSSAVGDGLCSESSAEILAVDAGAFTVDFSEDIGSQIVGPVFNRRGQVYMVTEAGEVVTSAYSGTTDGASDGDGDVAGEASGPFHILGWRQSY